MEFKIYKAIAMNTEKLDEYISGLSNLELVEFAKKTAQNTFKNAVLLQKSLDRELNTTSHCSRALRTTLYANSHVRSKSYMDSVELLKYIVKKL